MPWSSEQAIALAPDASSAKAGRELAVARKWATLGTDGRAAWGTVQGSGKTPYQASIDLSEPAFKCSCPSRKFPCKHGLGLLIVLAEQPSAFTETSPPAWTAEWLGKRAEKEEKRQAKSGGAAEPEDPEAAAKAEASARKRAAARETKVGLGLRELGIFLEDLARTGIAALPGKPPSFWSQAAARLVDAQAPGLARRVAALDGLTARESWPERVLREIALLHLAREAWTRVDDLPEPNRADLRAALGFTTPQEDVLATEGIRDRWLVLGRRVEDEDRIRVQRTWLWGEEARRFALVLSFSATPRQPFDVSLVPGTRHDARLAFFPGAFPQRALVKESAGALPDEAVAPALPHEAVAPALPHASLAEALASHGDALAANPWIERVPFAFRSVVPWPRGDRFVVRDDAGDAVPLRVTEDQGWSLVSLAGGRPVALAGEWDGEALAPVGAWSGGRYISS